MMRKFGVFGKAIPCVFALAFILALCGFEATANAQGLEPTRTIYVIGNHNGMFTWPLRAYTYQSGTLIEAETWRPITRDVGPTGLAVDPYNEHLFVSYEGSAIVDVFDATDATPIGQINLSPSSNICGMDIHVGRSQFFVVNRAEKTVYVFDTDTFAPVDQWVLPTGAGAWDLKLVENYQGADVIFITDATQTIRWYDIDTHDEIDSYMMNPPGAVGLAVYIKDDGNPVIFTGAIIGLSSTNLTKIDVDLDTEQQFSMNAEVRGLYVSQVQGQLFATVGQVGLGGKPTVRVWDVDTVTELTRADLVAGWSPCDVKGTWLTFGSTVQKDCTSHPNGDINMTDDVTFTITVKNKYSRPIHVLPLKDTYDTTQLTFVSATPAPDDNNDDGEITWSDLIPSVGHDLAYLEEYTVTVNFKAEPENCTSGNVAGTNVALMSGAQDDMGTVLDDASGSFAYKVWCNCVIDADCDDGIYCNGVESCVEKQCQSSGNPCPMDDGLWCTGEETITCIEAAQECGHTGNPCVDDGDMCNGDEVCNEEEKICEGSGDPCTDDGLFCNGTEFCSSNKTDCQHTGDPCEPNEHCNEEEDICDPFSIDDDTDAADADDDAGWPEGKVTGGCCGCGK
jgi:DNA-binding beta-propeller fold protein YncE